MPSFGKEIKIRTLPNGGMSRKPDVEPEMNYIHTYALFGGARRKPFTQANPPTRRRRHRGIERPGNSFPSQSRRHQMH